MTSPGSPPGRLKTASSPGQRRDKAASKSFHACTPPRNRRGDPAADQLGIRHRGWAAGTKNAGPAWWCLLSTSLPELVGDRLEAADSIGRWPAPEVPLVTRRPPSSANRPSNRDDST